MLFEYDSKYVRLVLRVYFNVAFLLFALIGNAVCVNAAKLDLLRHGRVNVTRMTGWLTSFDPSKVLYKLRRLPCGWIGALMIVCAILSLISDLTVSVWVHTVAISTQCLFVQGMVISPKQVPTFTTIPNNGNPYQVAAQAQLTSQANGGSPGIYWKVNRDRNFRAAAADIIGSWECQDLQKDKQYPPEDTTLQIVQDLQHNGLLFPGTSLREATDWGNGSTGHLVAWTPSINEPGTQFSIRASIDLATHLSDPKTMKSFLCTMHADPISWVLNLTHPVQTLNQWVPILQGSMYDGTGTPAVSNISSTLEWLLNSMIMVGGGANNLLQSPPTDHKTQGCVAPRTTVLWPVEVVFLLVSVILLVMPVYLVVILIQLRHYTAAEKAIFKKTPDSLLGWLAQAAKEKTTRGSDPNPLLHSTIKSNTLVEWEYGLGNDGSEPGIRRKDAGGEMPYQGVRPDARRLVTGLESRSRSQVEVTEMGDMGRGGGVGYAPYRPDLESSTAGLLGR